jgi:hypothetical protein
LLHILSAPQSCAGEDQRRLVEIERPIYFAHQLGGALVFGADDDPVGPLEILDRRSFSQKTPGLETTQARASGAVSRMMRSTSSPVPTGTVDLVTTTAGLTRARAISSVAPKT